MEDVIPIEMSSQNNMCRFAENHHKSMPVNIEIKAFCSDPQHVADILLAHNADYKGNDHQIDTYFNVSDARLKLREGSIENNLIYYKRDNQSGPKRSDVILYPTGKDKNIKEILKETIGIKVVVDKKRDIYFIENVKFHVDRVEGLGDFVEIEAIGEEGDEEELNRQCEYYIDLLEIPKENLIEDSYSDLLLK